MAYETIRFTVDGHIARMTLNRPQALNAISPQMLDDMQDVAAQVAADPHLRVLIIDAEGRAFCAGADLKAIDAMEGSIAKMQRFLSHWKEVFCTLEDLPRPVIGVCQGLALAGGFELLQIAVFLRQNFGHELIKSRMPAEGQWRTSRPNKGARWMRRMRGPARALRLRA